MSGQIALTDIRTWLNEKVCELSLSNPEPLSDDSFLAMAKLELLKLIGEVLDPYFHADKQLSYRSALTRELMLTEAIRDEKMDHGVNTPDDESWQDVLMLQRCIDILQEFDRFIEKIGGYS